MSARQRNLDKRKKDLSALQNSLDNHLLSMNMLLDWYSLCEELGISERTMRLAYQAWDEGWFCSTSFCWRDLYNLEDSDEDLRYAMAYQEVFDKYLKICERVERAMDNKNSLNPSLNLSS